MFANSNLFSNDQISAWIGVIGTLIGTIIGGGISYLVAYKSISDQRNKENEFDNKIKVHLDNYIEYSFGSLFYFIPDLHGNQMPTKKEFLRELEYFRIALKEISCVSINSIPGKYIKAISDVKLLYQILEVELSRVLDNYDDPEKLKYELNKINIKYRTLKIIEHYSKIANDNDFWNNLIKELEESFKQINEVSNIP